MSGLGHLAAGLALKPAAPEVPLWALMGAGELNDALYFVFNQSGLEKAGQVSYSFERGAVYLSSGSVPYSHGLAACLVWSIAAALLARLVFRNWKAGAAVGLAVLSHWLLDFLMHSNLPLAFDGSPLVGLGLENSAPGFIFMTFLDLALLAGGLWIYFAHRRLSQARSFIAKE